MALTRRYHKRTFKMLESSFSKQMRSSRNESRELTTTTAEGTLRLLNHKFRSFKQFQGSLAAALKSSRYDRQKLEQYVQKWAPWGAFAAVLSVSSLTAAYSYGMLEIPSCGEVDGESSDRPRQLQPLSRLTFPARPTSFQPTHYQSLQFSKSLHEQREQQELEQAKRLFLQEDGRTIGCSRTETLHDKYQVDWSAPALGRGAFGSVHAGVDTTTGRGVALKRIDKLLTDTSTFKREINAFFQIQKRGGHPHILEMKDIYEDDHYYYLVIDLAYGGEVYDDLIQHGPYTQAQAAGLIFQLASALNFIHTKTRLVHADLKPENLLLKHKSWNYNDLSLIDFGCAVPMDAIETGSQENISDNPVHYSGTTAYWPPERFQSETTPTPAMDMWTVGVILFILMTNKHPFDPEGLLNDEELHANICNFETVPKIAPYAVTMQNNDGAWDGAQDVLNRLMAKNPKERMTAEELMHHPWVQQHLSHLAVPESKPEAHLVSAPSPPSTISAAASL